MICAYLDDAGTHDLKDAGAPYHYMGGVLIEEARWRPVHDAMESIAKDVLGANASAEFHGAEMVNGTGAWKGLTVDQRRGAYERCLMLLREHDLPIGYARCDKERLRKQYHFPMDPRNLVFWLFLERLAKHCNSLDQLTFIVADDSKPDSRKICRDVLSDYRANGPPFGEKVDVSRVIDTVHFMDSRDSRHIQLCDLALYVIRRLDATKDETWGLAPMATSRVTFSTTFPYKRAW